MGTLVRIKLVRHDEVDECCAKCVLSRPDGNCSAAGLAAPECYPVAGKQSINGYFVVDTSEVIT